MKEQAPAGFAPEAIRGDDTRQRLIAAGLHLFSRHTYGRVRTRALVQAAQANQGCTRRISVTTRAPARDSTRNAILSLVPKPSRSFTSLV